MNVTFDTHHFKPRQFVAAFNAAGPEDLPDTYTAALTALEELGKNRRPFGADPNWIDALYLHRHALLHGAIGYLTPPLVRWLALAAERNQPGTRITLTFAEANTTKDGRPVLVTTDGRRLHALHYQARAPSGPGLYTLNPRAGTIHAHNPTAYPRPLRYPDWGFLIPKLADIVPAEIVNTTVNSAGVPVYVLSTGHWINRKYVDEAMTLKTHPTRILAPPEPYRPICVEIGPHFAVIMPMVPNK